MAPSVPRPQDPALPELSLVAPVYDECLNLAPLHARVAEVFGERTSWELVLVDDGSRDGSDGVIRELMARDARVRGVFLARNSGQSAALVAGWKRAQAPLVATLDADLQNDPADLPAMLLALGSADAVVGWRVRREDSWQKRVSSRIANRARNWLSGDSIRDTGCSLKVFRAAVLADLPRFHGMHRFLPTLLRYQGYRVVEHPVSHHRRRSGRSKYGFWNRAGRATVDLLAIRWMRARLMRAPEERVRAPEPAGVAAAGALAPLARASETGAR
jgi:glycosyltransferase involved in cell wall biosynthesis